MPDMQGWDCLYHNLWSTSVWTSVLVVLHALCLDGTRVDARELVNVVWVGLTVYTHKQSSHHLKKGAHVCARIVHMVLVVDSDEQGIHVGWNCVTANIQSSKSSSVCFCMSCNQRLPVVSPCRVLISVIAISGWPLVGSIIQLIDLWELPCQCHSHIRLGAK